jgi:hypothetical protein
LEIEMSIGANYLDDVRNLTETLEVDERTITVTRMTGNGEKEITRDEFIKVWLDNAELWGLVDYDEITVMTIMVDEIKEAITELAGHSWDLKYIRKIKNMEKANEHSA